VINKITINTDVKLYTRRNHNIIWIRKSDIYKKGISQVAKRFE